MKAVTVFNHDGSASGTLELPDDIFGIEPSETVLHQVITAYLANQRQGNACALTRSEVDVAKKKPFKQKGTGRARAGSANSPLWVGGGVVFGPKPRSYYQKINKKMRQLGMKSALSIKAREDQIRVVEDFSFDKPETKRVAGILKALKIAGRKVVFVVPDKDDNFVLSSRNIPRLLTGMAQNATTYDIMNADVLLMTRASVDRVKELFHNEEQ